MTMVAATADLRFSCHRFMVFHVPDVESADPVGFSPIVTGHPSVGYQSIRRLYALDGPNMRPWQVTVAVVGRTGHAARFGHKVRGDE